MRGIILSFRLSIVQVVIMFLELKYVESASQYQIFSTSIIKNIILFTCIGR